MPSEDEEARADGDRPMWVSDFILSSNLIRLHCSGRESSVSEGRAKGEEEVWLLFWSQGRATTTSPVSIFHRVEKSRHRSKKKKAATGF